MPRYSISLFWRKRWISFYLCTFTAVMQKGGSVWVLNKSLFRRRVRRWQDSLEEMHTEMRSPPSYVYCHMFCWREWPPKRLQAYAELNFLINLSHHRVEEVHLHVCQQMFQLGAVLGVSSRWKTQLRTWMNSCKKLFEKRRFQFDFHDK